MISATWNETPSRHLQLTFTDHVDARQAEAALAEVKSLLASVAPGFTLVTDLSGLTQMDLECERWIDQAMDVCNRAGVRKVIRVVPQPEKDIGFGIMSLFHYRRNVKIVTCDTMAEAEAALGPDGPIRAKPATGSSPK